MIKVILFDCDGLIIKHEKYFTIRLAEQRGQLIQDESEEQKKFFRGVFLECETGKKDLKQELGKHLDMWSWDGSVEGLMDFWFSGESSIDTGLKNSVMDLRQNGTRCFLSTNNEKYRTEYIWNSAGLKNIFEGLFSSCYVGCFKEDQQYWEKVCQNFTEIRKEEILVWDDDQKNVECASAFGLHAQFYTNRENFLQTMQTKYELLKDA